MLPFSVAFSLFREVFLQVRFQLNVALRAEALRKTLLKSRGLFVVSLYRSQVSNSSPAETNFVSPAFLLGQGLMTR